MRRTLVSAVVTGALAASLFAATPANAAEPDISGSGSSFANNFVTKCAAQYQAKTGNKVTYTSTGSGTGRTNFANGTSDFAFSDVPVQSGDKAKPAGVYVTVPVIGGAIAIVHSVAGVKELKLDAATLGAIFAGDITKWNDPAIAALNAKATLPDAAITVIYRSTSSGTTQGLQEYLNENGQSKFPNASSSWAGVKTGASVSLSTDMAYKTKNTPNAIGYVDLSDIDVKVGRVSIKNGAGKFVKPTVAAAASMLSKQTLNTGGDINIDYAKKVKGAYQIALVTYALIPDNATAKGAAVQKFVEFAVSSCSKKPAKGYSGFKGSVYSKALWFAKQGS
jgi:phosphate transport system substrate-binding protein